MLIAHLAPGSGPSPSVLSERLEASPTDFPLLGSRMQGKWWVPSSPPDVTSAPPGTSPIDVAPIQPFDLHHEAPLRVIYSTDRSWLMLCAHHFAIDGLGMVSLLRSLLGGSRGVSGYRVRNSPRQPPTGLMRRFLKPADSVASSLTLPSSESFSSIDVALSGPDITARLCRASVEAVREHNLSLGRPLRRIGLSVAVGGVGRDAATYRRIDLTPGQDVEGAVKEALADPSVPTEIKGLPPGAFLIRPFLNRFSDTLLVSNLGKLDLDPVSKIEFYPVARGRSGLSIGAAGVAGQSGSLTLRATNLNNGDASSLLGRIVAEFTRE